MLIYLTTKKPWNKDNRELLYVGGYLHQAQDAVPEDLRYYALERSKFPSRYPYLFSAIPDKTPRKMIAFFSFDKSWASIVSVQMDEEELRKLITPNS